VDGGKSIPSDFWELSADVKRWIFILEGLLTVCAGFVAYFAIVDYPETAKFLTAEERAWTVWVRTSDQGAYGEAEHVTFKFIRDALSDWQVRAVVLASARCPADGRRFPSASSTTLRSTWHSYVKLSVLG
jgi:hypothetical protein